MGNADCRGEVREGTKTGQEFGGRAAIVLLSHLRRGAARRRHGGLHSREIWITCRIANGRIADE